MRYFFLCFISCLIYSPFLFAQESPATLRGRILTPSGEPAVGATLRLNGTQLGTVAQSDGTYTLSAPVGRYTLVVQSVGFQPQRLAVHLKRGESLTLPPTRLNEATQQLKDVVVTGQYEPQSMRQSVYQVRTIDRERIQLRAATNLTGVLNNELGIRFSNDLTLGTSDIQLMGMSGRNVKILLDGVPMVDRGDTRESLNQIDINTIERVEIVEGPMAVSYGSDALAGVINIITRKPGSERFSVNARLQEESAGREYSALTGKGLHNQNVSATWQRRGWNALAGGTHNDFGGWQGQSTSRAQDWKPKEQWLGNTKLGFRNALFSVWYRLDALNEMINSNGPANVNTNQATDQKYLTNRYTHQVQSDWRVTEKLQLNGILAYTDYSRRTQTTNVDLNTGRRTLALGEGLQDLSRFNSEQVRLTAQYKVSSAVSLQPGIDLNREGATGARILGSPVISDYAFFVSSEIKPTSAINIRPGLRFIKNSVYNAPPVIPSVNTKFRLNETMDLRLAYARGFRSPALRELYFNFFDASHSIIGNPNLKAEYSNSFNGSLTWQAMAASAVRLTSVLTGFYNDFHNLINYGYDPTNPSVTMTINVDRFKTTGGTLNNTLYYKNLQATLGFSYIGRYNSFNEGDAALPQYVWSPEVNSNLTYNLKSIGTKVSLFYKYAGKRPAYESTVGQEGTVTTRLTETAAYHWADFTVQKTVARYLTLNAGVKNLFNVTRLSNTSMDTGSAHSTGGPVPLSYGRSYFLGLNFQLSQ